MDDAAGAAAAGAWAAAIAAIFGPIIGVVMANTFAKHQSIRQEAAQLFRRIMEDSQKFRHAFMAVCRYQFNQLSADVRLSRIKTHRPSKLFSSPPDPTLEAAKERLELADEQYAIALRELREIESILNADILSLGLLFDKQSEKCGRAIQELIAMSELFNREERPSDDDCQKRLNELIQRIMKEMKPLHDSLRRSDPDADLY